MKSAISIILCLLLLNSGKAGNIWSVTASAADNGKYYHCFVGNGILQMISAYKDVAGFCASKAEMGSDGKYNLKNVIGANSVDPIWKEVASKSCTKNPVGAT